MEWLLSTSLAASDATALFINKKSGTLAFFQFFSAPSGVLFQGLAIHCTWLSTVHPSALTLAITY